MDLLLSYFKFFFLAIGHVIYILGKQYLENIEHEYYDTLLQVD